MATDAPQEEIVDTETFLKLLDVVAFYEKRKEAPPKGTIPAIRAFVRNKLNRMFRGTAADEEVIAVVKWYWPHVQLDTWQPAMIRMILSGRRTGLKEVAIKGCTGCGKGAMMAIAANLWYTGCNKCKIVLSGPNHDHVLRGLFAEIVKWRSTMTDTDRSDVFKTKIEANKEKTIYIVATETEEAASGHHGPNTITFFDEASSTNSTFYNQADTFSRVRVSASNPRTTSGFFYDLFPKDDPDTTQVIEIPGGKRALFTISAEQCMNVIKGEEIIPGQINRSRLAGIKSTSPAWYRVMGQGRFPIEDASSQVILPTWIKRHKDAWYDEIPVTAFGLDVAASMEGDRSILACGSDSGLADMFEIQTNDVMQVTGWALQIAKSKFGIDLMGGLHPVTVDCDGLGKGVGHRLLEMGCRVLQFEGNRRAQDGASYTNARTEAWGELALRLNPEGEYSNKPWGMLNDAELMEELLAGEKIFKSDGVQWALIPKRKRDKSDKRPNFKAKIGRSPDKADAVVYLYHSVRELLRYGELQDTIDAPLVASENRGSVKPFSAAEVEELPDYLKEIMNHLPDYRQESFPEDDDWDFGDAGGGNTQEYGIDSLLGVFGLQRKK